MRGRIITSRHETWELPELLSWELLRTGSVPCDSFEALCPYTAVLGPGELCLFSGEGAVILRRDGSITLRGTVKVEGDLFINGMPWAQAQGEGG